MSTRRILASSFVGLALVFGAPARAQAPAGGGSPAGGIDVDYDALAKAPVGSWAEYSMSVPGKGELPKFRYALVAKSATKLSLEIDSTTPKGDVDMRFDFGPLGKDGWKVTGGKVKLGAQTADFPPDQLSASPPIKKGVTPGGLVGTENVVTPAGTFSCKHYKKMVTVDPKQPQIAVELWMNEKVAPTGVVKSSLGPMSMTLSATGKGAESKIK